MYGVEIVVGPCLVIFTLLGLWYIWYDSKKGNLSLLNNVATENKEL
jgi:hypothetical protein